MEVFIHKPSICGETADQSATTLSIDKAPLVRDAVLALLYLLKHLWVAVLPVGLDYCPQAMLPEQFQELLTCCIHPCSVSGMNGTVHTSVCVLL